MKILQSLLMCILIVILNCTSCLNGGSNFFGEDNNKIADETFSKIISAIETKDSSKMLDMLSDAVENDDDLSQSAIEFVNFVNGDITSVSAARESGVSAEYKREDGKRSKVIISSFSITTTESIYQVAIKECLTDEFDNSNVGIMSIYIIENWTESYSYGGGGKWTPGINVQD